MMRKIIPILTLLYFIIFAFPSAAVADTIPVDSISRPVLSKDALTSARGSKTEQLAKSINKKSKEALELTQGKVQKTVTDDAPSFSSLISVSKVFWSLVIIGLGYIFIRLTSKALELLAEKSTKYRITIKSFIPVIKILGWIFIIFLIVAGVFHPPATTILAFSASIGVAVGFASQDILKNIFGGIMILFDRPFRSGDKIEVGNHYGEVVEIGLRSTRVVTPDDNLVSIPNSEIMNSAVSNANAGEPNCQVTSEIYLSLHTDTKKARLLAIQAAQVSKYIFLNKPITIIFTNEFKDRKSVFKMKIKAYVLDIRDEFKFKSDMTELVIASLVKEGMLNDDKDGMNYTGSQFGY